MRRGSLRLGVVSTAKYFAPRLMAAFMAEYPDIEMRLAVGNRSETIGSLRDHDIDIALMGRPPQDIPVRAAVFGDHPLVIIAAPGHALVGQRDITRERIARESFLMREPGSGTRISMEIFMRSVSGWLEKQSIEMDSNETIKQSVMAGLGVAFISAHTVASELESSRLALLGCRRHADTPAMVLRLPQRSRDDAGDGRVHEFLARKAARHLPLVRQLYVESSSRPVDGQRKP